MVSHHSLLLHQPRLHQSNLHKSASNQPNAPIKRKFPDTLQTFEITDTTTSRPLKFQRIWTAIDITAAAQCSSSTFLLLMQTRRGGFRRGKGGRGDRGCGGRRGRRGGRREVEEKWVLVTKLDQIVETILGPVLKDEVMKILPVQNEADQLTRFKAFVVVGEGWDTPENGDEVEVHYIETKTQEFSSWGLRLTILKMRRPTIRKKCISMVLARSENDKACPFRFCYKCLLNRYGEKIEEMELLCEWQCPKCKGIYNRSFCMKRRGNQPAGILAHTAKATGISSVSEMLQVQGLENIPHSPPPWPPPIRQMRILHSNCISFQRSNFSGETRSHHSTFAACCWFEPLAYANLEMRCAIPCRSMEEEF